MTHEQRVRPAEESFFAGAGDMGVLVRSVDWSKTPFGPLSGWPQSLRTAVSICLNSRFPIALYWGPEYLMLYNQTLAPMIGPAKHPRALGQPAGLVLAEIWELIEPLLRHVRETGEATWSEDLMLPLARAGTPEESYFTFTYSPIRDESGGVGGVFCAAVETTEKVIEGRRLRLLNALAERAQVHTPAEACAHAAAEIARVPGDVPFALLYLDDGAGKLTLAGAANIEAGSKLAPREAAALEEGYSANAPEGARGTVTLPIEHAGGGQRFGYLVCGLSPLLAQTGSYSRFHTLLAASISQGVSGAAAYQEERTRAETLAELDRAKTAFFSNVSHELRTPLTLMLGPAEDALAEPLQPAERERWSLVHRNALRLSKLVNTLLDFSRIEAGRIEASYEPVDLSGTTSELASMFRSAVERAGLRLRLDLPRFEEPAFVDREMWEKIVLNLLSNALKFTFEGEIAVSLQMTGSDFELIVRDSGIGIAPADLPRLFERFHRIKGARARTHEGTGIGLALVAELIKLHGGTVRAESAEGQGTSFCVRLPRGSRHLQAGRLSAARTLPSTSLGAAPAVEEALRWTSGEPEAVPAGTRPRIVLADDNADMRDYVSRLLRERWDVEAVSDGEAALAAVRRQPPALVLSDVMMPRLDGFGLLRAMRNDAALRFVPVLLLSARAGEEATAEALRAGADDYLVKPFSARELLARVDSKLLAAAAALAAQASERQFREVVENMPDLAWTAAPDGGIDFFNHRWYEYTGTNFEQMRGWGWQAVQDPAYVDAVVARWKQSVESGKPFEMEFPIRGADGIFRWFMTRVEPLHDAEGRVIRWFGSSTNIDERRRNDDFKETFLAILGHDLRNPLSTVLTTTRVLELRSDLPAGMGKKLARVISSGVRMQRMIEQLLDLTRARLAGGIPVVLKEADVAPLVSRIVEEIRAAHPRSAIELSVEGSCFARVDTDRFEQVVSNLLENAVTHGDETKPILVELACSAGRVTMSVRNWGTPIEAAFLPLIFNPFARGPQPRGRSAGLGLGLYISERIVDAHRGKLTVQSSQEAGTVFEAVLPGIS
jgi:PAS domain S-box-containing protein